MNELLHCGFSFIHFFVKGKRGVCILPNTTNSANTTILLKFKRKNRRFLKQLLYTGMELGFVSKQPFFTPQAAGITR